MNLAAAAETRTDLGRAIANLKPAVRKDAEAAR